MNKFARLKTEKYNDGIERYPSAIDVANTLIIAAGKEDQFMNYGKLNRLLYLTYASYLKSKGPMFPERFAAWPSGPVVTTIYSIFADLHDQDIKTLIRMGREKNSVSILTTGSTAEFLTKHIWDRYGSMTATELAKLITEKGQAWSKAMNTKSMFLDDADILKDADLFNLPFVSTNS